MSMKKLKSQRGETLIETLMAIIIAVLAFAALTTAVLTAGKINARVRSSDVSTHYSASTGTDGRVTLSGLLGTETGDVSIYENNGYYYYTAGGTTP